MFKPQQYLCHTEVNKVLNNGVRAFLCREWWWESPPSPSPAATPDPLSGNALSRSRGSSN